MLFERMVLKGSKTLDVINGNVTISVKDLTEQLRAAWLDGIAARSAIGVPFLDPSNATWEKVDWSHSPEGKLKWEEMANHRYTYNDAPKNEIRLTVKRWGYLRFRYTDDGTLQYHTGTQWADSRIDMGNFTADQLRQLADLRSEIMGGEDD